MTRSNRAFESPTDELPESRGHAGWILTTVVISTQAEPTHSDSLRRPAACVRWARECGQQSGARLACRRKRCVCPDMSRSNACARAALPWQVTAAAEDSDHTSCCTQQRVHDAHVHTHTRLPTARQGTDASPAQMEGQGSAVRKSEREDVRQLDTTRWRACCAATAHNGRRRAVMLQGQHVPSSAAMPRQCSKRLRSPTDASHSCREPAAAVSQ